MRSQLDLNLKINKIILDSKFAGNTISKPTPSILFLKFPKKSFLFRLTRIPVILDNFSFHNCNPNCDSTINHFEFQHDINYVIE